MSDSSLGGGGAGAGCAAASSGREQVWRVRSMVGGQGRGRVGAGGRVYRSSGEQGLGRAPPCMLRLGMHVTHVPLHHMHVTHVPHHPPPTLKRPTAVASMMSLPSLSLTARVTSIRVPTSGALLPGCSAYCASPRFLEPPAQGVVWHRCCEKQGLLGAAGLQGLQGMRSVCGSFAVGCRSMVGGMCAGWHVVRQACCAACCVSVGTAAAGPWKALLCE